MNSEHETNIRLTNGEIERYSRQLIIPEFGIDSQIRLKSKSALIIGCGGLGCPSALYLSTSGLGRLGLVDNDTIEITNIHRQIAHDANSVGLSKARNLADKCKALNDLVKYDVYECVFEKCVAIDICKSYDVILDCTDNVITRYLINDVCVLLNKPLVSGSALKMEGQLTVYNHENSPCYRCLYPVAPPPETVSNCSDSGILGPIVGMIGSLQALETIKILANIGTKLNGRMLIFDGLDFQTRIIKLRPRQIDSCLMCKNGQNTLTDNQARKILDEFDYTLFCGVSNYNDKALNLNLLDDLTQRVSCDFYFKEIRTNKEKQDEHILIDVRPKCQFQICSLDNSINIPFDEFQNESDREGVFSKVKNELNKLSSKNKKSIYVVCRRGNDSQLAVDLLCKHFFSNNFQSNETNNNNELSVEMIKDLIGGLKEWSERIDPNFPKY